MDTRILELVDAMEDLSNLEESTVQDGDLL